MNNTVSESVRVEQLLERIRQERETFNQRKEQDQRWFRLRLLMGYVSVVLLPAIFVFCSYIILHSKDFSDQIVASASASFFGDVVAFILFMWKVLMPAKSVSRLEPVSRDGILEPEASEA
jgi:ABC-type multidrug transport system fused ATPase/permease subunit